jgi:hypothetical protein
MVARAIARVKLSGRPELLYATLVLILNGIGLKELV